MLNKDYANNQPISHTTKYRTIVWGAGIMGQASAPVLSTWHDVLFYVDRDPSKWGSAHANGNLPLFEIKAPDTLLDPALEYDKIVVAVADDDIFHEIRNSIVQDYGVPQQKIISFKQNYLWAAHEEFIWRFTKFSQKSGISGNMAELGVYQGLTARLLNKAMPDKKLYLYDTFESFNKSELEHDYLKYGQNDLIFANAVLKETTAESVIAGMPFPDKVIVKQGWFPDTFDTPDEQFCFVHIDPDLYAPTKSGLELFYPRLVKRGCILVHDYFMLSGVTQAVDEFLASEPSAIPLPIGDYMSLAIIKP